MLKVRQYQLAPLINNPDRYLNFKIPK